MAALDKAELVARLRAIQHYAGKDRDDLSRALNIPLGTLANWFTNRSGQPTMEQLVELATVWGVPRRFAERGFADLEEDDGSPSRSELVRRLDALTTSAAARDEAVLAMTAQLAALQAQVDLLQRRQQP